MNNSNQASNSGGFSFGSTGAAAPSTGFSFGGQTSSATPSTGFSFGSQAAQTSSATPSTGLTFGSQAAQTSSATPSIGFSFGGQAAQTSSAAPSTGLTFGNLTPASSATSATAFNLPASTAPTSSAAPSTGLNFGNITIPASSATSATAFKLAASTATTSAAPSTGFSFATGPTTTKNILASSLSQPGGVSTSAPVSQAVATGLTGAKPGDITKAAAGPSIGSSLSAGVVKSSGSAIGSQLSSSLSMPATGPSALLGSKTASVTTSGPSTVTTTTATSLTGTTGAAGSSGEGSGTKMTYKELEEQMNKWAMELEHQEKLFLEQATKVNAWDKVLIKNGEEITTLNSEVAKVKLDQRRLNDELDFIVAQQKELEEMLVPLEENVAKLPAINYQQHTDSEREHTYQIAEHIDAQLKRMTEDLKEVVDHLNTGTSSQDKSDPMLQISKILNAHMESLQWVDQNAAVLQKKTEEVARYADYTKKEHEKNFRLAYS